MTLSPGDRVDRYEVAELLGSGGMGVVYRAHDPKLERPIALKILRLDQSLATDGHVRLLREARAVATLSHPNVLAVYDVGEVAEPERLRGLAYIAMELVVGDGRSGRTSAMRRSRIGRRLIDWLRDVARALSAAHEAGVVHRDVKPENVMIRNDGIVKVLDFGVARRSVLAVDALTSTEAHSLPVSSPLSYTEAPALPPGSASTTAGGLVGTLYYMAPEQLLGEPVDGRVDQFAWGVLAYELLVGEGPWAGRHEPIKVVSQNPFLIVSSLPRRARRACRTSSDAIAVPLSREPSARFASMAALLATIEGAVDANPGAAPRAEENRDGNGIFSAVSPRRAWRSWRGARAGWALVIGASVAAAVAALSVSRGRTVSPNSPPPSSPEANSLACTSSAACATAHGGDAWRCQSVRHECVELASVDCKVLAQRGDVENDETLWFGGLFPTTGEDATNFASQMRALDLARQDFAGALGSSASRTGELHTRPIGVVLCDETVDATRAAGHLARDVEAPAVVGFRSAQTALTTIPGVFLPNHVLSFVTISQAADLNRIPEPPGEPRLVWRSTLDSSDMAAPLAALLSDVVEPRIKGAGAGRGEQRGGDRERAKATRVAIVRWSGGSRGFAEAAFHALRFNGKNALENGDDFRQFVFDEEAAGVATDVVDKLLGFRPNVVFALGAGFASKVMLSLEEGRGGGETGRPTYLIPSADFGPQVSAFVRTRRRAAPSLLRGNERLIPDDQRRARPSLQPRLSQRARDPNDRAATVVRRLLRSRLRCSLPRESADRRTVALARDWQAHSGCVGRDGPAAASPPNPNRRRTGAHFRCNSALCARALRSI